MNDTGTLHDNKSEEPQPSTLLVVGELTQLMVRLLKGDALSGRRRTTVGQLAAPANARA